MQKIWMLSCQCIIYLNIVKITEKQQEVCGIIIEMNLSSSPLSSNSESFKHKTSITVNT